MALGVALDEDESQSNNYLDVDTAFSWLQKPSSAWFYGVQKRKT